MEEVRDSETQVDRREQQNRSLMPEEEILVDRREQENHSLMPEEELLGDPWEQQDHSFTSPEVIVADRMEQLERSSMENVKCLPRHVSISSSVSVQATYGEHHNGSLMRKKEIWADRMEQLERSLMERIKDFVDRLEQKERSLMETRKAFGKNRSFFPRRMFFSSSLSFQDYYRHPLTIVTSEGKLLACYREVQNRWLMPEGEIWADVQEEQKTLRRSAEKCWADVQEEQKTLRRSAEKCWAIIPENKRLWLMAIMESLRKSHDFLPWPTYLRSSLLFQDPMQNKEIRYRNHRLGTGKREILKQECITMGFESGKRLSYDGLLKLRKKNDMRIMEIQEKFQRIIGHLDAKIKHGKRKRQHAPN